MPHYFVLDAPAASPAKCGLCGYGGADRKYLDPRLDFEFYGSLIFCESCIGTMANDFNFISPNQALRLTTELEQATNELAGLKIALVQMENAYDSIVSLRSLFDRAVPDGVDSYSEPVPQSVPKLTVGADSISAADERLGDSEINESSSKQGPNDVPDSKSADPLLAEL